MLYIVTALPCEAKPLIRHYRLNGRHENGFRIYANEQLRLIIAGIGKYAAAAACAYLQGATPDRRPVWLNLGIAGHHSLEVGSAVLAHKVHDAATGKTWYPAIPFQPPCPTVDLVSVDQPESEYHGAAAYDMEAAGFYAAAGRFNTHEMVQVFKIISDNRSTPAHQVTADHAEEIVAARLDTLDTLLEALSHLDAQLAQQQPPIEAMHAFLQRWRFSVSQRHQLQRLLQRWQALGKETPDIAEFAAAQNSKQVIAALRGRIAAMPLRFDPP